MFCLVLGFQNCSQSSLQDSVLAGPDVNINLPTGNVPESGEPTSGKVTYVEIPNVVSDFAAQQKAGEIYRLVISMNSGEIQAVDDRNTLLEKRCLSKSHLDELKTILSGSSVCEAVSSAADQCAMRYKAGYASLFVNEKRVNLGEELDSCGRGRKDLCGATTDVFKAYLDLVRNHWAQMECEE
ncbi:MAG: hypothetical protein HUU57_11990 [Bdellovibrio sp.]|nr:hypothetical protein [Bdellovibrio sp.]